MRRTAWGWAVVVAVGALFGAPGLAGGSGTDHPGSIGNFWFELDQQRDRSRIVVNQGDRITFTVREYSPPAHTVNVDELGIDSPDLFLLDTYTTPPLDRPGSYLLYCRPHRDRGHATTLVVRPAPTPTPSPAPAAGGTQPARAPSAGPPGPPTPEPTGTPEPEEALPTDTDEDAAGQVEEDPASAGPVADPSLPADVLGAGVVVPQPEPWTRAVQLFAAAAVLVLAAAAVAFARDAEHRRLADVVAAAAMVILPSRGTPEPPGRKRRP